jgi:hypothetical protein
LRIRKANTGSDGLESSLRTGQATLCFVDAQGLYELRRRTAKDTFESAIKMARRHAFRSRESVD